MSVRKGERGPNKFEILNDAGEMTDYIIKMCANDSIIPKGKRWVFAYKIVDECNNLEGYIASANVIFVKFPEDYIKRRNYQLDALCCMERIDRYLNKAYNFHLMFQSNSNSRKIDNCYMYYDKTYNKLKEWIETDEQRFSYLLG